MNNLDSAFSALTGADFRGEVPPPDITVGETLTRVLYEMLTEKHGKNKKGL